MLSASSFPREIWLDGRNIGRANGTGVHHYAANHCTALQEMNLQTAWLLENTETIPPRCGLYRFLQAILAHSPHVTRSFQSQWGSAHLAQDVYRIAHVHYRYHRHILKLQPPSPPDIMHWTYPLPVLMEGCRNIVTIHDLIPLTHPKLTGIDSSQFHHLIENLIEHSVEFITVSETIRQQMLQLFPIAKERVTTLYQPVEFDDKTIQAIKQAPQIAPSNSFIFYGRVEHRKNIERLLTAHALSRTSTPLVIIGPEGDDRPDCSSRGPTSNIIRLPWSERLSLLRTLSEAKALLFPSLAEGFGIPIIEAMCLGVPVLTSRGGVTEEIAHNAAYLCNPTADITEMADAIVRLDTLSSNERKATINKGQKRAQFFSMNHYKENMSTFLSSHQRTDRL